MRTQSNDTDPTFERIQIAGLRRLTPCQRFQMANSLTRGVFTLSCRATSGASMTTWMRMQLPCSGCVCYTETTWRIGYPSTLIATPPDQQVISPDWVPVLEPVISAFDALGVPYLVGGSLASSAWGLPRSTQDADLVADLQLQHEDLFVARLQNDYYIDASMIRDAIARHSAFNILHLDTMLKVDVFISSVPRLMTRHFSVPGPRGWMRPTRNEFCSPHRKT